MFQRVYKSFKALKVSKDILQVQNKQAAKTNEE